MHYLYTKQAALAVGLTSLFVPFVASAADDPVAVYAFITNNLFLTITAIVGVVASVTVLISAKKMGGGVFGSVLKFFGQGMMFVVLGFIIQSLPLDGRAVANLDMIHNIAFTLGYILMVIGAQKLLVAISPKN